MVKNVEGVLWWLKQPYLHPCPWTYDPCSVRLPNQKLIQTHTVTFFSDELHEVG